VYGSCHEPWGRPRAEARKLDWLQYLDISPPNTPRAFIGPIAAGEKVVAAENSAVYKFLRQQYGDALAVEMEGFGFMRAMLANNQVQAMVVRGISDMVEGKNPDEDLNWQPIAADHAAAFTFQMLSKLQPDTSHKPPTTPTSKQPAGNDISSKVRQTLAKIMRERFNLSELQNTLQQLIKSDDAETRLVELCGRDEQTMTD